MNENALKIKVQRWILIVSSLILIGKFIAYFLTNSVGVLTDAMESIVNVLAGALSLYSLYWSSKPIDKGHPFGHGKMELISASAEGIMITIAGLMIIYEGGRRLFLPAEIQKLDVGIYIVSASGVLNYLMGWYSIRMGKKYGSIALVAGGKHLQSDTYSTIGLVAGLLILFFTGKAWIDSALALIFGSIIIITGISILRKTIANLLDKADEQLLTELAELLNANRSREWVDIHNSKVIKYGNCIYMDCDLTIPWYFTIEEGHRSGAKLKEIVQNKYANRVQMTIHLDPCNIFEQPRCSHCGYKECPHRKEPFRELQKIDITTFTGNAEEQESPANAI